MTVRHLNNRACVAFKFPNGGGLVTIRTGRDMIWIAPMMEVSAVSI